MERIELAAAAFGLYQQEYDIDADGVGALSGSDE